AKGGADLGLRLQLEGRIEQFAQALDDGQPDAFPPPRWRALATSGACRSGCPPTRRDAGILVRLLQLLDVRFQLGLETRPGVLNGQHPAMGVVRTPAQRHPTAFGIFEAVEQQVLHDAPQLNLVAEYRERGGTYRVKG